MIQLTLIRQLILHLILLHLSTPALHTLRLSLEQLKEPAAITGAHRTADTLQNLHLRLSHAVHPGIRWGKDRWVEPHLSVVIPSTGVVVVPRALDADRRGGSVTGVLPWHGGTVTRRQLWGICRVIKVCLHCRGNAVGASHPSVTAKGSKK